MAPPRPVFPLEKIASFPEMTLRETVVVPELKMAPPEEPLATLLLMAV